ncbi:MAG: hypothetical protein VX320_03030 [Candidatus Thermoplasmatota archaeon]|nr:hypothetical protein [Candidatus Thermoplasmatota archaeon]MEE3083048.1 hypothetical protein [Candidatus Thermoplasmatota archaeon]|tara:strand:+ start:111 stop:293 length:183 start_codon:yes stop_codon:yes gene_type:complete
MDTESEIDEKHESIDGGSSEDSNNDPSAGQYFSGILLGLLIFIVGGYWLMLNGLAQGNAG